MRRTSIFRAISCARSAGVVALLLALSPFAGGIARAQSSETRREVLTNRDVTEMVAAEIPEDVILSKIRSTPSRFDLSTAGLVALRRAGASPAILRAMTASLDGGEPRSASSPAAVTTRSEAERAPAPHAVAPRTSRAASDDPSPPSEPGIYMLHLTEGGRAFTRLEPTVFSQGKSGNWLATSLTYGIAKTSSKAVVRGPNAGVFTTDPAVAFYFVFDQTSPGPSGGVTAAATSPNEFTLLRLKVTRSSRETVIASANAYGSSSGTDEKSVVLFTSTRLRSGVYRVTPNDTLAVGEYCFFSPTWGGVFAPGVAAANRVFDFGVGELR